MNTLLIEEDLAKQYKYKKLPDAESEKYRALFRANIPGFLNELGSNEILRSYAGTPICQGYHRIVVGDYGAFVEFSKDQIVGSLIIKPGQEYRVHDPKYNKNIKYFWLTVNDESNIKIYLQQKSVTYADYKPGKYYVSVHEVLSQKLIDEFDGSYRFLSNFYYHPFTAGGITYPTNEHFFQAMKTTDQMLREKIAACETPGKAKRMGRSLELRSDWDDIKLAVMEYGLSRKFSDPGLRSKLLATGDSLLIEGNTWGDRYWGRCGGVGENHLGKLLMKLRGEIRKEIHDEKKDQTKCNPV